MTLQPNNLPEELVEFLSEERALQSYRTGLAVSRTAPLEGCKGDWISNAFAWDATKEGHSYWEFINKRWEILIEASQMPF